MSDVAKGAIRGLTADVMGAPVDLAILGTNLGIAGVGYLAHKLRLLKQPPDLIEAKNVPFSSDWHVKNSPLQDTGSAKYTAGRLTGNVLPGIASLARNAPRPRQGQVNALYPGGRDDLLLYHQSTDSGLSKSPNEFYNLSAGITKDHVNSSFGGLAVVLNPKKLEPRTSPTVIKNRDFYSPRWQTSKAGGAYTGVSERRKRLEDDLKFWENPAYTSEESKLVVDSLRAELEQLSRQKQAVANSRLADKFVPVWQQGGVRAEGNAMPDDVAFQKLGAPARKVKPVVRDDSWTMAMLASPRFQSFRHFEKSPSGANLLLGPNDLPVDPAAFNSRNEQMLRSIIRDNIIWEHPADPNRVNFIPDQRLEGPKFYDLVDSLASTDVRKMVTGPQVLMQRKPPDPMVPFVRAEYEPMTEARARELQATIRALRQNYRKVPSEYAETKTFGSLPINRETVAGIYSRDGNDDFARFLARKRRIPFMEGSGSKQDDFDQLVEWQNYIQKRNAP